MGTHKQHFIRPYLLMIISFLFTVAVYVFQCVGWNLLHHCTHASREKPTLRMSCRVYPVVAPEDPVVHRLYCLAEVLLWVLLHRLLKSDPGIQRPRYDVPTAF